MASLKLGRRLSNRSCKWDHEWQVYECGYPHSGLFGRLNCKQCNNTEVVCASDKHPGNKSVWDC
jgi:hypothetical protein